MPDKETFALINCILNGACTVFLVIALILIKKRKYAAHGWTMSAAIATELLFLTTYVTSKLLHGEISSGIPAGWYRFVYLYIVLFPHLILAIVLVPMVSITVFRAYKRNWVAHRKIAPWTLGIWFYVSITGVLIYFMLYQWYPKLYPEAWQKARSLI